MHIMSGKLCSLCDKRLATITISEVDDAGEPHQLACCHHCLERLGVELANPPSIKHIQHLNTLDDEEGGPHEEPSEDPFQHVSSTDDLQRSCPDCGITWQEFLERNRFGCQRDIEVFADLLASPLRELHGKIDHTIEGAVPSPGPDLSHKRQMRDLQRQLDEALAVEAFEQAALLRDQLKSLEKDHLP